MEDERMPETDVKTAVKTGVKARSHIWTPAPRDAVVLAALFALIAVACVATWTRPSNDSPCQSAPACPCWTMAGDGYDLYPCSTSGVSVKVEALRAYADPARTFVEARLTVSGARIPLGQTASSAPPSHASVRMTLQDAQGHSYSSIYAFGPAGQFTLDSTRDPAGVAITEFEPLPESALRAPQSLTLRVTSMVLNAEARYNMQVEGAWAATFKTPDRTARSISFHVAPQTRSGVTVQPLRLDIGSSSGALDGFGGGDRLILRVSGLPSETPLHSLGDIATRAGTATIQSNQGVTDILLEGRLPSIIVGAGPFADGEVGPTGAVDLEVIYLAPRLPSLTGTQTLSVNAIRLASEPDSRVVTGPWTFALRLG
ncbi:MAG TPA: hypothetical protein VFQ25_06530 [Ktedonobacterales bacterium]|nr:hypothetical protein [Ktedonobacterales bacterium]